MLVGILFTVIVSLAIGTFSALAWTSRRKVNPRYHTPAVPAFALFWLLMSCVWYLVAFIDFFGYMGRIDIASFLIYVMQVFVGFSLIVASRAIWRMLDIPTRGVETVITLVYTALFSAFLWSLFYYGVYPQPESFFVSQIVTAPVTIALFTVSFLPLWFAGLFLVGRHILAKGEKSPSRRFLFIGALALIFLGISGFFDETGIVVDWAVTAVRLVTLVGSIFAYSAVVALQEPDELVI